jgi:hypothetical protein
VIFPFKHAIIELGMSLLLVFNGVVIDEYFVIKNDECQGGSSWAGARNEYSSLQIASLLGECCER